MKQQSGAIAEATVAGHLTSLGYRIIDQNWRTPSCEIDIVARKNKTMYFVEVKYRKTTQQGTGADYITASKIRQMKYAARLWVQLNNWQGEFQLLGASVEGDLSGLPELIELVD